jgi:hypothetical protein
MNSAPIARRGFLSGLVAGLGGLLGLGWPKAKAIELPRPEKYVFPSFTNVRVRGEPNLCSAVHRVSFGPGVPETVIGPDGMIRWTQRVLCPCPPPGDSPREA